MAIDIFDELRKGNIDVLEKLIHSDRKVAIELLKEDNNKNEILMKILPIFRRKETWYGVAHDIFNLIYLDPKFKEYTYYLLHSEFVILEDLTYIEIKNMLEHTTWGFNYIVDNIDRYNYNLIIKDLIEYCKNDKNKYNFLKEKCLNSSKKQIRYDFIISAITRHLDLNKNEIVSSLYKKPCDYLYHQETLPFYNEELEYITSNLPEFLLYYAIKDKDIESMMIENFELFFKVDTTAKMKLLNYFYEKLPKEYLQRYQEIHKLYLNQPTSLIDKYISILLNNNLEEWLITLLKDKNISYLTSGSTTSVFRVGDKVLKFTLEKHNMNTIKNLFLVVPTEEKIICDNQNQPIMIVELQDYLEDSYDNIKMTKEDINYFFQELDNQGYELTDPHCLNKEFSNFGFLKDYHDANLGNYKSYEDFPDRFKDRPLVLLDVDLLYEKEEKNKKKFIC